MLLCCCACVHTCVLHVVCVSVSDVLVCMCVFVRACVRTKPKPVRRLAVCPRVCVCVCATSFVSNAIRMMLMSAMRHHHRAQRTSVGCGMMYLCRVFVCVYRTCDAASFYTVVCRYCSLVHIEYSIHTIHCCTSSHSGRVNRVHLISLKISPFRVCII